MNWSRLQFLFRIHCSPHVVALSLSSFNKHDAHCFQPTVIANTTALQRSACGRIACNTNCRAGVCQWSTSYVWLRPPLIIFSSWLFGRSRTLPIQLFANTEPFNNNNNNNKTKQQQTSNKQ
jgi:hypothetical protein